MSYKEDFSNADGWSAADVSIRLNTLAGGKLLSAFKANGVDTIIRYYASSVRPKTLTPDEAILLSKEGFGIVPVFQDSSRRIANFSTKAGTDNAKSAMDFAKRIGQPESARSTILFAVDADYTASQIDGPILDYFQAVASTIGSAFQVGAYPNGEEVPWSAAFISWVVRRAGPAYANFQFASGHSVFVNNAIKARVTGRVDKPFWGYRITEERPAIGDIIQRNRGKSAYSFSFAENHAQYASHSDIVVEVTPDVVRVVGGNVGDTVSTGTDLQEYTLDANGFLEPGQRVIALLKNRAGT